MNSILVRICVLSVSLFLFSSLVLTGPEQAPAQSGDGPTLPTGESGMGLALSSLLLGGAMVFLFRPRRNRSEDDRPREQTDSK
jgi:hypothetical protein